MKTWNQTTWQCRNHGYSTENNNKKITYRTQHEIRKPVPLHNLYKLVIINLSRLSKQYSLIGVIVS